MWMMMCMFDRFSLVFVILAQLIKFEYVLVQCERTAYVLAPSEWSVV